MTLVFPLQGQQCNTRAWNVFQIDVHPTLVGDRLIRVGNSTLSCELDLVAPTLFKTAIPFRGPAQVEGRVLLQSDSQARIAAGEIVD